MKAVKWKNNKSIELRLRMALVHAGIRGWQVRPGGIIGTPDFVFQKEKVVIFVDGCFWHGCPKCGHLPKTNEAFWKTKIERNKIRDIKTAKTLRDGGLKVIRFWEHELRENVGGCIRKLLRNLRMTEHLLVK
jgi:DNA mismatch endonuclease (patch repair protein)